MPCSNRVSVAASLRDARSLHAAKRLEHSNSLLPRVAVRNNQRLVRVSLPSLQRFAEAACSLVWTRKQQTSEMTGLTHIDVLIVSDRRMAALHKKFCGVSGATDVLTFQHGEIVISADTAAMQARQCRTCTIAEIQLYLLHGLLHLAGFNDTTPSQRRQMHRLQNKLMTLISPGTAGCE